MRFASQRAEHRRRRRIALAAVALVVAVPTLALTAFRGSSDRAAEPAPTRRLAAKSTVLVSAAAQRQAIERLRRLDLPIYCAGSRRPYVALTFDDGPSPHTPELLRILTAANVRATFFLVGANMSSATLAAYARLDAEAGIVANHTHTHVPLTELDSDGVEAEIGRAQRAIEKVTGQTVTLFRPPFAAQSPTISRVTRRYGLVRVLWNTDSRDWTGQRWQEIGRDAVAGLEAGSIIVLHETRRETLKALRNVILPELKRRGLTAVTLPELFALDPPSVEQLRGDAARGACSHQHDGT